MVMVNKAAPDFSANAFQNEQIKTVKLSDYKGKWVVLFFYPADFTFVCPTELEELADNYEKFRKMNAEILSVSTDTHFVHKAWHDESAAIKKVKFPMLSDPTGSISKAYGTYIEDGDDAGLSLRGTFVVDPDGVIRVMEIHSNNIGRSVNELLRKLEAADFVRTHGGEVCPASWSKGKKTLKPGLDLVGKI